MDDLLTAYRKNLEQLPYMVPIFWIVTVLIFYFQDITINSKWITISISVGVFLSAFEYIWLRYILARTKRRGWFIEAIPILILNMMIFPLAQKYEIVYMFIAVSIFISLKLIFKRDFLKVCANNFKSD